MATIIISGFLMVVVAAAIISMVRDKKKGKSSCGCGCAGCSMNGACHPAKIDVLEGCLNERESGRSP